MKYLADILTFSRFILALAIWFLALFNGSPNAVFILFILAELTDAFDGTCANKWPFKKGTEPAYRKYAAKYDMFADVFLWFVIVFYLTLCVNYVAGISILFSVALLCGIIELVVYGKFFGHPNDCTKNSLCKRNFSLAKKIIMTRRYFYLATIILAASWILCVTSWSFTIKTIILVSGIILSIFLWFFLRQRRQHISRDAIKIEQKLSAQTQTKKFSAQTPTKKLSTTPPVKTQTPTKKLSTKPPKSSK